MTIYHKKIRSSSQFHKFYYIVLLLLKKSVLVFSSTFVFQFVCFRVFFTKKKDNYACTTKNLGNKKNVRYSIKILKERKTEHTQTHVQITGIDI